MLTLSALALVGAASFALFASTAQPQTDAFTTGTVILGQSAEHTCTVTHVEPCDSGT